MDAMGDYFEYNDAVQAMKTAILRCQYEAARGSNEVQLGLYYSVGSFVSSNTRNGLWGSGALNAISAHLKKELPGLRGFSERNLKYMRTFFEEWSSFLNSAESTECSMASIRQLQLPN